MEGDDRILGYASASPKRRWSWAATGALAVVVAALLVGIALITLLLRWNAGAGARTQFVAQIPAQRAAYLKAEGDARRGPAFEALALALDHKRVSGAPPTEAEMVQTLGPPDLMRRGTGGQAEFAYFYDRFGKKDWVVYFSYGGANSVMIGWNAASANPQTHAQMVPYAPPPATSPTTSATMPRRFP